MLTKQKTEILVTLIDEARHWEQLGMCSFQSTQLGCLSCLVLRLPSPSCLILVNLTFDFYSFSPLIMKLWISPQLGWLWGWLGPTWMKERVSNCLAQPIVSSCLLLTMVVKERVRIVVADESACKKSQSPYLEIPTCSNNLFEHWGSFCRKLSKYLIVMTAILWLCVRYTQYCVSCAGSLCLYSNYIV